MTSINDLYVSRCHKIGDRFVPHFWNPEPVNYYQPCLYGDSRKPANQDEIGILRRIIGIGLELEIEAGKLVLAGLNKELPTADSALKPLLKSNAADESRHYKGFQNAAKTYGSDTQGLGEIVKEWLDLADKTHPIYVTAVLESSLFLVTLGLMRIAGSPSITRLSFEIAKDEYRHAATNVAVSKALGLWEYQDLLESSLEWLFQNKSIRLHNNKKLTLDDGLRYSRELFYNLESPELDSLSTYSTHNLPFELRNDYMYTERVVDENYSIA